VTVMRPTGGRDSGVSAVEYALLLAGIVAVVLVSVLALTRVVGDRYKSDCDRIGTGGISAAPTPCP
jgi:Flp pilus assembly pilin Flp